MIKQLTKAEEQIMQVLWKLEKAYLKDLLDNLPPPRPNNNTIATLVKILIEKGFVRFEVHGRNHCYFPKISKTAYSQKSLSNLVDNYFEGSFANAISLMIDSKKLNIADMELLLKQLKSN